MIIKNVFWNFEMKTDDQIRDRRPDVLLINKINLSTGVKIKENEKLEKYLAPAIGLKKKKRLCNVTVTVIPFIFENLEQSRKSL